MNANDLGKQSTARNAWLVESGDYSDYRVHAVSLDEQVARASADTLGVDVREVPLLSTAAEAARLQTYEASVYLDAEGRLRDSSHYVHFHITAERPTRAWVYDAALGRTVGVQVGAGTETAARKAVREYAAEIGAEIAAGVVPEDAVQAFNDRHGSTEEAHREVSA